MRFPYFAVIQYHGARFSGWQRQPHDRTVQSEFEAALARISGRAIATHAAGRTDAGVHALGQVVSCALPRCWDPADLTNALNANVPQDIWVCRTGSAPEGFHARKHAVSRRYRYLIGCDPAARSPFRRPFEWAVRHPISSEALRACATTLVGEHDFRGLSTVGQVKPHYRCRILAATWEPRPHGEGFIFTIEADRFLHHMVRFLVGSMVDVAHGRRSFDSFTRLLDSDDNREASPPAPPEGLFFVLARYPHEELRIAHEDLSRYGPHW